MDFLLFLSEHPIPVAILTGAILSIGGLALMFAIEQKIPALIVVALGAIFAGLPLLASAKINKDGIEILVKSRALDDGFVKSLEDNTKAISELQAGLRVVNGLVEGLSKSAPPLGGTGETAKPAFDPALLKSLQSQLTSSISKADNLIDKSKASQFELNNKLQDRNILLDQFKSKYGL